MTWAPLIRAGMRASLSAACSIGLSAMALAQAAPPAALATSAPTAEPTDRLDTPLTATPGDAARGRAIVASRQTGLCLLCHPAPIPEERFQGNLAPDLAGAGARWSAGQLRLRLVDAQQLNPHSIMPAYHRVSGLQQVAPAWRGKPLLEAQQVEDVVAYLQTLK